MQFTWMLAGRSYHEATVHIPALSQELTHVLQINHSELPIINTL